MSKTDNHTPPTFPKKMRKVHTYSHGVEEDLSLIKLSDDGRSGNYFGRPSDVIVTYVWEDGKIVEKQM